MDLVGSGDFWERLGEPGGEAMDVVDAFEEWLDDGVGAGDHEDVRHEVVEREKQRPEEPLPLLGGYERYNSDLAAHCGRVSASLSHDLSRLGWSQRQLAAPPAPSAHHAALAAFDRRLAAVRADALGLESGMVLMPAALAALTQLHYDMIVFSGQLSALQCELQAWEARRAVCCARVVLWGVHRPSKKDAAMHDLKARVLTGALGQLRAASASLFVDGTTLPLAQTESVLDAGGSCEFESKPAAGSMGKVVQLRARVACEWGLGGVSGREQLESVQRVSTIVTTTETQWGPALGRLLAQQLFRTPDDTVAWCVFANALQRAYLDGTRQAAAAPKRWLSFGDLQYVHQFKFDRAPSVGPEAFESFWSWFSPALMGLRHSRQLLTLWCEGLVMGFISKQSSERLLENQPVGAFLIRFSERAAGSFAIAYVKRPKSGGPNVVKHYLLRPGDVAPPQRTLADFLGGQSYFGCVLKILPDVGPSNTARWRLVSKQEAFGKFYGSKGESYDGYEDEVGGD